MSPLKAIKKAIAIFAVASLVVTPAVAAPAKKKPAATAKKKPAASRMLPPKVLSIAEIGKPLEYGEYFWDETGVPQKGLVRVVVDLNAEQLYVYRGGYEIARTRIVRGWDKKATPVGTFKILEKKKDHFSSTYDNAPMPYNHRLTWDGVAIHGSDVDGVSASHGCVGVPLEFVRILFQHTKVGDPVFITNSWLPQSYPKPRT